MNKLMLSPIRQALLVLVTACIVSACTTEPDLLGLNLTPQGDKLNALYTDTTTLVAYNTPLDTMRTSVLPGYSGSNFPNILCGAIYDSAFGNVEANFATQLWLSSTKPSLGTNPYADSVILQLPYVALYGDSTAAQTIKIYELTSKLRGDTSYYSTQYITPVGSPICNTTFVPKVKDSVTLNSVKYGPMLRLRMDNAWGTKVLNGGTNLDTQEAFRQYIKGLLVTATPKTQLGQGSVITFDLTGTNAGIQIYYHSTADSGSMSLYVNGANSQRYNMFNFHGYQNAAPLFKAQYLAKDTAKGQQKLFLNGMSPTEIKIRFPYILNYQSKQRAGFNQAYLVIDAPYATSNNYPISKLAIYKIYKDGTKSSVEDQTTGLADAVSGVYDTKKKQYRFLITQYLQNILKSGKQDYSLMVSAATPGRVASELVIPGTKSGKNRIRLEMIYTTQK